MPQIQFHRGDIIYRQGEAAHCAYRVLEGWVELTDIFSGAHRQLSEGQMFGEDDMQADAHHNETAIAKTDCSLEVMGSPLPPRPGHGSLPESSAMSMLRMPSFNQPRTSLQESEKTIATRQGLVEEGEILNPHTASSRHVTEQLQGMGPLQALLEDDGINDILVNGAGQVYIERSGILEITDVKFKNDAEVLEIAEKICKAVGRDLPTTRPLMDARLLDGSRVNIIAPPLAVDGTTISIRKFPKHKLTIEKMVEQRNMSENLADFLRVCGRCRINVIISGGTGSGKTTMLNAISQFISDKERIVTIEEAAELQLIQPHVVRLETQPASANRNKDEEVSVRDLVRNALRMRPDRIIVGEVRGAEAFDMMQAMNTGHEGSLATIHANHPRDALSRLENMLSMANLHIPAKAMRFQIASSLHLVIQISRMRDGHRRVTHVSEIVGMEGDVITMHDLFNFNIKGEDEKGRIFGDFAWSGIMPRFVRRVLYYNERERLEKALGIKIPERL